MSSTALCSVTTVMMWSPFSPVHLAPTPLIARLLDSVAPLVKTISCAVAPISAAICSRAASTASSASQPNEWLRLAALPKRSREVRQHRLEHARIDRRRRVVVHVDRQVQDMTSEKIDAGAGSIPVDRPRPGLRPCSTAWPTGMRSGLPARSVVHRHLVDGTGRERAEDPLADLPERVAHVAVGELAAALAVGRAGGDGQRPVDRLDHVGDRDRVASRGPAGSRPACPAATTAGRGAPAAAAPSPSARPECRTARRSRGRSTNAAPSRSARCFMAISA